MKPEELQAIRELVNKATPGPWAVACGGDDDPSVVYQVTDETFPEEIARELLLDDAEFIAWCREGVPKLLDEVERLNDQLQREQDKAWGYRDRLMECHKAWMDAEAEIERLRGALAWYANPQIYENRVEERGNGWIRRKPSLAKEDRGERARQALEGDTA